MLEEPLPLLNITLGAVLPLVGAVIGWTGMVWLAERRSVREGVGPARRVGDVLFWGSVAALVAARLGAVLPDPGRILAHPLDILRISAGLSAWGAVVGFTATAWVLSRRWGTDFWRLSDCVALFAALPVFLSRAACLSSGYCGGVAADPPWGIALPGGTTVPRLPADLYEAVAVVALALALRWAAAQRLPSGALALAFVGGYGVIRALVSLARPEAGTVSPAVDQTLSLVATALAGAALWVRATRMEPEREDETQFVEGPPSEPPAGGESDQP